MSSPDEIRGTTQCPVAAKAPPTEPIVPVGGALAATAFSGARTAPDFIRATKRGCRGRTRTSRLKPLLQVFTRPVGAAGRHSASAAISLAMCSNYSPSHSSTRACGRGFSRDSFFWRSNGPGFHPSYETWMPGRTRTSRLKPLLQVFTRPVGAAGRHCASAAISPAMCSNYSPSHSSTRACGRGFSRDSVVRCANCPRISSGLRNVDAGG